MTGPVRRNSIWEYIPHPVFFYVMLASQIRPILFLGSIHRHLLLQLMGMILSFHPMNQWYTIIDYDRCLAFSLESFHIEVRRCRARTYLVQHIHAVVQAQQYNIICIYSHIYLHDDFKSDLKRYEFEVRYVCKDILTVCVYLRELAKMILI